MEQSPAWNHGSPKRSRIVASILPTPQDCCSTCCEVNIVDLPTQGAILGCCNHYDSLDELRNEGQITILVDDTPAQVYGGVTRGDGGGGFFYFDSSSIDPDDGASTIKPNSIAPGDPGRWKAWVG